MSEATKITLEVECRMCHSIHGIEVNLEDYFEYVSSGRRHIQDIFPYITPAERELLISNTCEDCWNKLFPPEEE